MVRHRPLQCRGSLFLFLSIGLSPVVQIKLPVMRQAKPCRHRGAPDNGLIGREDGEDLPEQSISTGGTFSLPD